MTFKSLAMPAVLVATVTSYSFSAAPNATPHRLAASNTSQTAATPRGGIQGNLCDADGSGFFIVASYHASRAASHFSRSPLKSRRRSGGRSWSQPLVDVLAPNQVKPDAIARERQQRVEVEY